MQDVQNSPDYRNLPIQRVGVTNLRYPIVVLDRARARQETVARFTLSVNLPHQFKGTHMSRFVELLNEHRGEITMHTLPIILADLRDRLDAESARIEVEFPYFLERFAPVSGSGAMTDYECAFTGELDGGRSDFVLSVTVPVTSLCPCSKAISDYGAHNQRGYVTIHTRTSRAPDGQEQMIWIEEIIEIAERSASAPVYPLLKRSDERAVTMQAYDNPVFVEDLVRNAAIQLQRDSRVKWFRVEAVNNESIHNHDAFAHLEWTRPSEANESPGDEERT
jgi:GTP cyclohydrolase IB